MLPVTLSVREAQLFHYTIASGDMRYIGVNERTVYLRQDRDLGPVVLGEIAGCGPDCAANLSQVLLEYALSCQGCQDEASAGALVECLGERLGRILAARLYQDSPVLSDQAKVAAAFAFILRSLGVSFREHAEAGRLRWSLAGCPLHAAAASGLSRGLIPARRGLGALCASLLETLAPGWALIEPRQSDTAEPVTEIIIQLASLEISADA